MPDTFDSLRPRIIDYLHDRGIDPRKRFRCLNPSHLDRDPSMGFDPKRDKVHCFACGADYDLFDLLALDNNLSSPADALSLASERYGDGSARRSVSFLSRVSFSPRTPKKTCPPACSVMAIRLSPQRTPARTISSGVPLPCEKSVCVCRSLK